VLAALAACALAAAAAWAVVQRVGSALEPATTRLRDDAYYYFAWAAHLAGGEGPCVTLGEPTSGLHFLWGLVLVVARILVPQLFVHPGPGVALAEPARWIGLMLHAATAVGIARWLGRRRGVLVGLLYLGNPFLLHEAQNGQETALACLCLLGVLAAQRARAWVFVLAAVAAVLARSDLILFVAGAALGREGWRPRALLAPGSALLAQLSANVLVTGRVLQDSTWPLPWLFWHHFLDRGPPLGAILHEVWWHLRPCLLSWPFTTLTVAHEAPWSSSAFRPLFAIPGAVLVWAAGAGRLRGAWRFAPLVLVGAGYAAGARDWEVAALGAALLAVLPGGAQARSRLAPGLLVAFVVLCVVHYVVRHHAPPYYFAPLGVCAAFALGRLLDAAPRLGLVLALALGAWQGVLAREVPKAFPWQEEMRVAARVARLTSPGTIGSFNSGIVTCYSRQRVVNLDGKVNAAAFAALRAAALGDYLDRESVRVLADWPAMFERDSDNPHASGRWFGAGFDPRRDLVEVARVDDPEVDGGWPGTSHVGLYFWRGDRQALPVPRRPAAEPDPCVPRTFWVAWAGRAGERLEAGARGGLGRRLVHEGADGVTVVVRVRLRDGEDAIFAAGAEVPVEPWEFRRPG
jgi:hypothetical protein